MSALYQPLRP